MESMLTIEGVNLCVFRETNYPNKPTVIFLHDSLGCITLWRDFPKKLAKTCQCNILIYDRQGYGKSDAFSGKQRGQNYLELEADILIKLMDVCKLKQAILFGHSDGGSIALLAAAKYPSRVLSIVTEGAHVFVEDITLNGIREAVNTYQTTNLKEKLSKYHGDKTEEVFLAWTKTWLSDTFADWNVERFLGQIQCPALIIQGEKDEFGTVKQVDAIVKQVAGNAMKLMLADVGHNPHKEALDITLIHILAFLQPLNT